MSAEAPKKKLARKQVRHVGIADGSPDFGSRSSLGGDLGVHSPLQQRHGLGVRPWNDAARCTASPLLHPCCARRRRWTRL